MSMYTQRIMAHVDWYKIIPAEELEDWISLRISDTAYGDGLHVLSYAVYFQIPTYRLEMNSGKSGCRIRMWQ